MLLAYLAGSGNLSFSAKKGSGAVQGNTLVQFAVAFFIAGGARLIFEDFPGPLRWFNDIVLAQVGLQVSAYQVFEALLVSALVLLCMHFYNNSKAKKA